MEELILADRTRIIKLIEDIGNKYKLKKNVISELQASVDIGKKKIL